MPSSQGLKTSLRALHRSATSETAKQELSLLIESPTVSPAAIRSLAAKFIKLAAAQEVTEMERDRLLELTERLPDGRG